MSKHRKLIWAAAVSVIVAVAVFCFVGKDRNATEDSQEPILALALVLRAERALDRGEGLKARELIDEALAVDPDCHKAFLYQGQFENEDGDWEEAFRWWARVPHEEGPLSGTARFLEGAAHLERDRARDAEQSLQAAIRMSPTFCAPYRELAELYLIQLRGEAARRTMREARLRQCLELEHLAAELLAGTAIMDETQAINLLQHFVAADPGDEQSLIALARYHNLEGDSDAALQIIEDNFQDPPVTTEQVAVRALMMCEERRFAEALELISVAEISGEGPLLLWQVHARLATAADEPARAAAILAYLVSRAPFDVSARFEQAQALSRAGQSAEAEQVFEDAELLDRLERLARRALRPAEGRQDQLIVLTVSEIAEILERLGEHSLAVDWLQQALLLDPDNRAILRRMESAMSRVNEEPRPSSPRPDLLASRDELRFPTRGGPVAATEVRVHFTEVTREIGLDFQYFNGGSPQKLIVETIGGGVAVLDYDGDGWSDLYFPQGSVAGTLGNERPSDRLFRNLGGRQFVDVTEDAGLGHRRHTLSCTVGDVDDDGDPDLFLTNLGRNTLYLNNGDGTFGETPDAVPSEDRCSAACAFADFDGDGLLDLYVVNYVEDWNRQCTNSRGKPAICDPQGLPPSADRLYRNNGQGEFVEISATAGADISSGKGLGVIVADLDSDGLVDIYVANDGTPNFLLRNESRDGQIRFTNIAYSSGAAVNRLGRTEAGMGIACTDFDGDGLFELFVTNFYRETNTLYHNLGSGLFADVTPQTGLAQTSRETLGFGAQAMDADLDGDDDLFIANGDIDDYSADGRPWKMAPQAFRNDGGLHFTDVSQESGEYFAEKYLGRGMARLDFDRDGRPDLVVVHHDRSAALLRNTTAPTGNWVALTLRGRESNRDGLGAVVVVETSRQRRVLSLNSGDGFGASNERRLVFGVAEAPQLASIRIHWPGGAVDEYEEIAVNRHFFCIEGTKMLSAESGPS